MSTSNSNSKRIFHLCRFGLPLVFVTAALFVLFGIAFSFLSIVLLNAECWSWDEWRWVIVVSILTTLPAAVAVFRIELIGRPTNIPPSVTTHTDVVADGPANHDIYGDRAFAPGWLFLSQHELVFTTGADEETCAVALTAISKVSYSRYSWLRRALRVSTKNDPAMDFVVEPFRDWVSLIEEQRRNQKGDKHS